MKMTGNTILVTGGGSGIGREIAQRFHALGNVVIVTGRRAAMLEETIAGRDGMHARELEMMDPGSIEAFAKAIVADFPALNVLINNAGILPHEDLVAIDGLDRAEATVATNLLGPIRLGYALLPHLLRASDATIVNVTSGLAFVPMTIAPTYSASKAAMHSLSQSWREQLRGKIEVIELAPPAVQTDLTPGQRTNPHYLPLDDFSNEIMGLFQQVPTPQEVLVKNVLPARNAEKDGRFEQMFALLNPR